MEIGELSLKFGDVSDLALTGGSGVASTSFFIKKRGIMKNRGDFRIFTWDQQLYVDVCWVVELPIFWKDTIIFIHQGQATLIDGLF